MSDISKLIEALRVSQSGGTRAGDDNPILPLDQPLVVVDGKLTRAADAPKAEEPAPAPKPAEASTSRPASSSSHPSERK
jgi:hypothetical protein